jgi:hypothetical protein
MNSAAQKILTTIKTSLQNIIRVRGTHVHSRRFTDADFDRLTFLENMKASASERFIS